MKKIIVFILICLCAGCSYGTKLGAKLIKDPHYAEYQEQAGELERTYLDGKMTYPEYLEKKKQLDDKYAQEVQEREETIHQQPQGEIQ